MPNRVSVLAENTKVSMNEAPNCCDGRGKCDGQSLRRLGARMSTGDLALISFSIPESVIKQSARTPDQTKSIRVWYVVVATEGDGDGRLLTGILTGEGRQILDRQIDSDEIEQLEPIKFTPLHVCGGILHQGVIKQRRRRLSPQARK